MGKTLKVNWTSLKKLGDNTLKNSTDFEESRQKFQEIIDSLPECWEGIDSEAFIKNCDNFLNDLKKDSLYFKALSEYFGMSSDTYNKVVDTHSEKIKKMNTELEEEKELFSVMPGDVASSSSVTGVI